MLTRRRAVRAFIDRNGHGTGGRLPTLDEGDGGLLKSRECRHTGSSCQGRMNLYADSERLELGSTGGGAAIGIVGHHGVGTLAHEPTGGSQRLAGLVLIVT